MNGWLIDDRQADDIHRLKPVLVRTDDKKDGLTDRCTERGDTSDTDGWCKMTTRHGEQ